MFWPGLGLQVWHVAGCRCSRGLVGVEVARRGRRRVATVKRESCIVLIVLKFD